ncbi:MAG TPA: hypothetical protein VGK29_04550 [Paludibaculum sp.]|jgi:hypothetical protein
MKTASVLLSLLLFPGFAAQNHDGTWKLNSGKSDTGERQAPQMTMKVTSKGAEFEVLQTTEGGDLLLKFRSDGKEAVNPLPGGAVMRSTHRITDDAMLGEYRIATPEGLIRQFDRITYTADGKTMTMEREIKTTQGDFKIKLVFDKQ